MAKSKPCPCRSGQKLPACCQRWLAGAEPPDPVTLMRSRFTAYALGEAAHLWRTTAPGHPLRARPRGEAIAELTRTKGHLRFRDLTIHDTEASETTGRVLFTAVVFEKGRARTFSELSDFVRTDEGWRYLDGLTRSGELPFDAQTIAGFEALVSE